jgi:antitoxin (DNA-binding transcriptional repressor) of toxin-antitoxin stability system
MLIVKNLTEIDTLLGERVKAGEPIPVAKFCRALFQVTAVQPTPDERRRPLRIVFSDLVATLEFGIASILPAIVPPSASRALLALAIGHGMERMGEIAVRAALDHRWTLNKPPMGPKFALSAEMRDTDNYLMQAATTPPLANLGLAWAWLLVAALEMEEIEAQVA